MICPACFASNEDQAEYCDMCGERLGAASAPSAQPPAQPPPPSAEAPDAVPARPPPAGPPPAGGWGAPAWGAHEGPEALPEGPGGPLFAPEASPSGLAARAAALGSLIFLIGLAVAEAVVFLSFLTGGRALGDLAKAGGVLFYGFHHVGLQAEFPTFDLSQVAGAQGLEEIPGLDLGTFDVSYTVAAALLLGTLLMAFLLFRAGRRVALDAGESAVARILWGASVAVPYAFLSLLLSFAIGFEPELGESAQPLLGAGGTVSLGISPLPALLWPLCIGAVAGALGGLSAAGPLLAGEPLGMRALAALKGGGWMLLVGSAVAFVGLLVLAGSSPDLTADYFGQVTSGRSGLALLLFTVLAVPNLTTLGLSLGMGSSVVMGQYLGGTSVTILSLTQFPKDADLTALMAGAGALGGAEGVGSPQLPFQLGSAPPAYFFFVLAPLVGALLGGRLAARAGAASTPREGAALGAGAGLVFALGVLALSILAGVGLRIEVAFAGIDQDVLARVGPRLLVGAVLAILWGVAGGAVGGATGPSGGSPRLPRGRAPRGGEETAATGFEGMGRPAGAGTGFETSGGWGPGPGAGEGTGEPEPPDERPEEPVGARVGEAGSAGAEAGPGTSPAAAPEASEPPVFDFSIASPGRAEAPPAPPPPPDARAPQAEAPPPAPEAPPPAPEAPPPAPEAPPPAPDPASDWLPPELNPDRPPGGGEDSSPAWPREPESPEERDEAEPWVAVDPQEEAAEEPPERPQDNTPS